MKILNMLTIAALTIGSTSAFAQDTTKQKMKTSSQKIETIKYTCTMHPEVISDKPGKCPKCGMDLIILKKKETKIYSCPIHPEVTGDKPGKCSKCGMDLTKPKKEEAKIYSCPMHAEVTSDKPGTCPKCGKALKENKIEDHSDHQH